MAKIFTDHHKLDFFDLLSLVCPKVGKCKNNMNDIKYVFNF
jgi:hypothetical protein